MQSARAEVLSDVFDKIRLRHWQEIVQNFADSAIWEVRPQSAIEAIPGLPDGGRLSVKELVGWWERSKEGLEYSGFDVHKTVQSEDSLVGWLTLHATRTEDGKKLDQEVVVLLDFEPHTPRVKKGVEFVDSGELSYPFAAFASMN
ncbi:hypothetical protein JCM11641_006252 [Rhodosporidiobolus odoratus]